MSDFVEVPTLSVRFTLHEHLPHNEFENEEEYLFGYDHTQQKRRRRKNHRDCDVLVNGSPSRGLFGDFPNAHHLTSDEIYETQWDFDANIMQLRHYVPPHLGMLLVTETLLSTYALAASSSSGNPTLPSLIRSGTFSTSSTRSSSRSSTSCSSSSSSYATHDKVLSSKDLISSGLINLGNTCYLNAQLQCAFHIPHVRSLIMNPLPTQQDDIPMNKCSGNMIEHDAVEEDLDLEVDENDRNREKRTAFPKLSPGFVALRSVFSEMIQTATNVVGDEENDNNDGDRRANSHVSKQQRPPVSTAVFCRSLGINPMEQQDAQEFWKLLLPHLECEPLTELYHGMYEDYITALDGSGRERRREESFLDLSLEVSSGSVTKALEKMFQEPELLSEEEGNGWRPEKGAPKVDALKGSLMRRKGLPSILQFHLKRFCYDWQSDTMSKLNSPFSFPLELNFERFVSNNTTMDASTAAPTSVSSSSVSSSSSTGSIHDEDDIDEDKINEDDDDNSISPHSNEKPRHILLKADEVADDGCIYDLQSIVIHVGKFGAGHYYTYLRPRPYTTAGTIRSANTSWYRLDDSRVTPVTYRDVVEDAFGGKVSIDDVEEDKMDLVKYDHDTATPASTSRARRRRRSFPFFGLFSLRGRDGCNPRAGNKGGSFGYGGKESCAYMLQYVKRSDIPLLYGGDITTPSGKN